MRPPRLEGNKLKDESVAKPIGLTKGTRDWAVAKTELVVEVWLEGCKEAYGRLEHHMLVV